MNDQTKLIDNILDDILPNVVDHISKQTVDVVLGGGAFNGYYTLGSMFYLKKLEQKGIFTINRVSGVSVGSLCACLFILDEMDSMLEYYVDMRKMFHETYQLSGIKKFISKIFKKLPNDTYKRLNGRLFISYSDVRSCKHIVTSRYKSNKDVIYKLICSCYVPFLMDGSITKDGKIDGILPYVFKNLKNRVFFIRCINSRNYHQLLNLHNESASPSVRIIEGILNCHNFFAKGNTSTCTFVDDWGISDYLVYEIKKIICVMLMKLCNSKYVNDNISTIKTTITSKIHKHLIMF